VRPGDGPPDGAQHRVFGCPIETPIDSFNGKELLAIGWFGYEEVVELAVAGKLRTGFELPAIVEFQRRRCARSKP
jgi:hypothetical protein